MGLLDLFGEVVTEYKADASKHVTELKKIENAEDELAVKELEHAEARKEHFSETLETIGKVTLAIAAFKETSELALDGYREALQESKLKTASFGVDIEKLSEAAGGLKTELELLEFAAKANNSAFQNTQEDMEVAERAIRKLEARGVPASEAVDAITHAVVDAKVKGLVPFGIVADTTIDKLGLLGEENLTAAKKMEVHGEAMKALREFTKDTSDEQDNLGDSMKRTEVKLTEAWASVKKGLGQLVVEMQPLLDALASAVGLVGKLAKYAGVDVGGDELGLNVHTVVSGLKAVNPLYQTYKLAGFAKTALNGDDANLGSAIGRGARDAQFGMTQDDAFGAGFSKGTNEYIDQLNKSNKTTASNDYGREFEITPEEVQKVVEEKKKAAEAWKRAWEEQKKRADKVAKDATDALVKDLERDENEPYLAGSLAAKDTQSSTLESGKDMDKLIAGTKADLLKMSQQMKESATKDSKAEDSFLKKTFGPVGEFDLYKKGFDALTSGMGNMYDTIVAGQEPAGAAFKKMTAQFIEAIGKQMFVESLKETAYGISYVAQEDYPQAAAHFAAAGEFLAGSVVAGGIASALGYGSPSPSAPGAGAGAAAAGGGGGGGSKPGNGNGGPIIVYGDTFSNESPRSRARRSKAMVAAALGTSGAEYG